MIAEAKLKAWYEGTEAMSVKNAWTIFKRLCFRYYHIDLSSLIDQPGHSHTDLAAVGSCLQAKLFPHNPAPLTASQAFKLREIEDWFSSHSMQRPHPCPEITIQDIWAVVRSMGSNKAPDLDGVLSVVCKVCTSLPPYIQRLFVMFFTIGHVPRAFKTALVVDVPKKQAHMNIVANMRPISLRFEAWHSGLQCTIGRTFELKWRALALPMIHNHLISRWQPAWMSTSCLEQSSGDWQLSTHDEKPLICGVHKEMETKGGFGYLIQWGNRGEVYVVDCFGTMTLIAAVVDPT